MNEPPPAGQGSRGTLEIHTETPGARVRKAFLLACARHGLRKIHGPVGQINFVLVGDRRMARLHREYTGIGGTTDVLTFDLSEGRTEGDVYICLDQARRQARQYGVPLYEEVARLAVHGVLHLAGYDDHSVSDRQVMRRLEDQAIQVAHRKWVREQLAAGSRTGSGNHEY